MSHRYSSASESDSASNHSSASERLGDSSNSRDYSSSSSSHRIGGRASPGPEEGPSGGRGRASSMASSVRTTSSVETGDEDLLGFGGEAILPQHPTLFRYIARRPDSATGGGRPASRTGPSRSARPASAVSRPSRPQSAISAVSTSIRSAPSSREPRPASTKMSRTAPSGGRRALRGGRGGPKKADLDRQARIASIYLEHFPETGGIKPPAKSRAKRGRGGRGGGRTSAAKSVVPTGGKDRETLSLELQTLKKAYAQLEKEKTALNTRVLRQEEELVRADRSYSELLRAKSFMDVSGVSGRSFDQKRAESSLVRGLKARIRDMESSLAKKDAEIKSIRTDSRYTRVAELELELKTYYEETLRLQRLLELQEQMALTSRDRKYYEGELRSAESRLLDYSDRLAEFANIIKSQKAKITKLKTASSASTKNIESVSSQLETTLEARAELEKQLLDAATALELAQAATNEARVGASQSAADAEAALAQATDLGAELEAVKSAADAAAQQAKADMIELRAAADRDMAAAEERAAAVEKRAIQAEATLANATQVNEDLKDRLAVATAQLEQSTEASATASEAAKQAEDLQSQLEDVHQEAEAAKMAAFSEKQALTKELEAAAASAADLEKRLAEIQTALAASAAREAELAEQLSAAKAAVSPIAVAAAEPVPKPVSPAAEPVEKQAVQPPGPVTTSAEAPLTTTKPGPTPGSAGSVGGVMPASSDRESSEDSDSDSEAEAEQPSTASPVDVQPAAEPSKPTELPPQPSSPDNPFASTMLANRASGVERPPAFEAAPTDAVQPIPPPTSGSRRSLPALPPRGVPGGSSPLRAPLGASPRLGSLGSSPRIGSPLRPLPGRPLPPPSAGS